MHLLLPHNSQDGAPRDRENHLGNSEEDTVGTFISSVPTERSAVLAWFLTQLLVEKVILRDKSNAKSNVFITL